MCGTVTSICVASNALALKAIEGVEVTILAEGCSGLSNEDHEAALKVMECCQCNVVRDSGKAA
jgi:nicotinamidase-related amidase